MKKLTLILVLLLLAVALLGCSADGDIKDSEGSNLPEAISKTGQKMRP